MVQAPRARRSNTPLPRRSSGATVARTQRGPPVHIACVAEPPCATPHPPRPDPACATIRQHRPSDRPPARPPARPQPAPDCCASNVRMPASDAPTPVRAWARRIASAASARPLDSSPRSGGGALRPAIAPPALPNGSRERGVRQEVRTRCTRHAIRLAPSRRSPPRADPDPTRAPPAPNSKPHHPPNRDPSAARRAAATMVQAPRARRSNTPLPRRSSGATVARTQVSQPCASY